MGESAEEKATATFDGRWLGPSRLLHSPIAKNVLSLYSLRFANYALPLMTVPYLVRVLGAGQYGLLGFAQGLIAYFGTAVDYGFDWSATREISVRRGNVAAASRTAMSVWAAKALLLVLSLCLLIPVTLLVPKVREAGLLVWIISGSLLGRVLFPTWLFQGLEQMTGIAVINIFAGSAGLLALLLFVRQPGDLLACAVILTLQSLLGGICGAALAFHKFEIRPTLPRWSDIARCLRDGLALFLSAGAAAFYTSGNAFVLGMVAGNLSVVGYYVAAERLVRAAIGSLSPVSQAFFPKVNNLAHTSRELALREGRKILAILAPLGFGIFAVIVAWAPTIVRVVFGAKFAPATTVLRILAFNVPNLALATVWSTLMMMSFKRDYAVMKILFIAGILNVGFAVLIAPRWGAEGMAACVVVAETFVNAASFIYTLKHGLNPIWPQPAYAQTS